MSTPRETDPFFLDDHLRSAFDDAATPPPAPSRRMWAALQPHLRPVTPTPPPTPRRAPLLAGAGGLVVGMLLMWGVWPAAPTVVAPDTRAIPSVKRAARLSAPAARLSAPAARLSAPAAHLSAPAAHLSAPAVRLSDGAARLSDGAARLSDGVARLSDGVARLSDGVARLSDGVARVSGEIVGTTGNAASWPTPVVLLPLAQAETALAALAPDTARATRERRRAVLLTERIELAKLTRRTDSLLLMLGVGPGLPPARTADSLAPAPPATLPPSRRFSVALAFAPERNFFGLGAPAADTLSALRRTHEQGRGGYNASAMAEYRLDSRLSVGAGLGVASYGAELRLTESRTLVSTHFDSATTISATVTTVTTRAYAIRPVPDSILAPILNVNQQVIGYQYLPTTRLDTVWTYLTLAQNDTVIKTKYLPFITTRQETSARILRPNYRFLTVPLLVRYRLGRATEWTGNPHAPRWWADVAVGAQLQWFLGGTQATTRDGLTYHTERVGPRGGPFRPLNVALTGQVAVNYALTPRLSASLAPTLRYQVASVYKPSTNLTQRPTATGVQVGVRFAF